ncbi:hypothetical protein GW17_00011220 [Ensete ventricosum]|nr:hypothetical protein GW17_00011220 [Ensete ventricosum]
MRVLLAYTISHAAEVSLGNSLSSSCATHISAISGDEPWTVDPVVELPSGNGVMVIGVGIRVAKRFDSLLCLIGLASSMDVVFHQHLPWLY